MALMLVPSSAWLRPLLLLLALLRLRLLLLLRLLHLSSHMRQVGLTLVAQTPLSGRCRGARGIPGQALLVTATDAAVQLLLLLLLLCQLLHCGCCNCHC